MTNFNTIIDEIRWRIKRNISLLSRDMNFLFWMILGIYDRILEMCVPLYVGGSSYRSDIAHEKMGKMKTFFATAESSQAENIIEQTGTKTI